MPDDEIESALAGPAAFEPGPHFVERVMDALRRAEDEPAPLAFPWRRLAAGIGAMLACGPGAALAAGAAGPAAAEAARGGLGTAGIVLWTLFALAVCWLVGVASQRALDP